MLAVILFAFLAVGLAEEAKVLSTPLAYAGYPYAGLGYAGAYGYAGYPHAGLPYAGYPYAVAAPAKVEVKTVEAPALPAVTYAAAPAFTYAAAAPVVAAAPAVTYAAAAPAYAAYAPYSAGSQFHAQDEFGNLNYGYANINSNAHVVGNTYGGVTGGYSYVDANGELQQVQYIADGAGFRVADSRLPVAPVYDGVAPTFNPEPLVAPTFNPVLPVAPVDTPEVAEAKAAHLAAHLAAAAPAERKRREADPAFAYGFRTAHPTYAHGYAGLPYAAGLPYGAGYGYAGLGYGLPYYG
eukprot:GFUD01015328.1.p1 GENE.GFUD01015328.1~~GFUD01015328.1.p1  ORF type:complete len:311 (-),score=96.11 GFUD01015328.1:95-979(-)